MTHSITLIEVLKCGVNEIPEIENPGAKVFIDLWIALNDSQVNLSSSKRTYFIFIIIGNHERSRRMY
jgi:hypothetical protein